MAVFCIEDEQYRRDNTGLRGTDICYQYILRVFIEKDILEPIAQELQDPSDYVFLNIESIRFFDKKMCLDSVKCRRKVYKEYPAVSISLI